MNDNFDFIRAFGDETQRLVNELDEQQTTPPRPPFEPAWGNNQPLSDELLQSIIELRAIDVKRDVERPPYCLIS